MQAVNAVKKALLSTGDFEIKPVVNGNRGKNPEWIFLLIRISRLDT